MRVAFALLLVASTAHADRPVRGSASAGIAFPWTGDGGDHVRFDVAVDLKPKSRYGVSLGWRQFDDEHRGLVVAGLVYEAGAARPRFVLDLHVDAGVDLDRPAPLVAGGIRNTLAIIGPLAVVLDLSAYVVIDGVDDSRLQLASSALVGATW